jgi:hypothetical protein
VDLHQDLEESIDRVYSREEILRYIMFARQFKPKIGKVSRMLLKGDIIQYCILSIQFVLMTSVACASGSGQSFDNLLQGVAPKRYWWIFQNLLENYCSTT